MDCILSIALSCFLVSELWKATLTYSVLLLMNNVYVSTRSFTLTPAYFNFVNMLNLAYALLHISAVFFAQPPFSSVGTGNRGERIVFWWPNTNRNIIRYPKNDQIQIRILFGFPKMIEYKYEYYLVSQKQPNTNTNIIRLPRNDRIWIRISFGFTKMIWLY